MTFEASPIDLWAGLGAGLTFLLGVLTALGRLLIAQFERRLDERFRAFDSRFATLERALQDESREWQRIEREILTIKADLPIHYVRREDYIRNQSVIEAKLDGLAGVPLYEVRDILGHASITQTEWYSHLAHENLAAAVGRL